MTKNYFKTAAILILVLLALAAAYAQEANKLEILKLNYRIEGGKVQLMLVEKLAGEGYLPNYGNPQNGYRYELKANDGSILGINTFEIPMKALALLGDNALDVQGTEENLIFDLYIPYIQDARSVDIYNPAGDLVLSVNLERARAGFAASGYNWIYVALPLAIVAVFIAFHEISRKRHMKLGQQTAVKNYIAANLKKGYSQVQIKSALSKNGYSSKEIDEGFKGTK